MNEYLCFLLNKLFGFFQCLSKKNIFFSGNSNEVEVREDVNAIAKKKL